MFSAKDNDQPKAGFLFRSNTGNIQTLLDLQANNELVLSLANNHTNNAGAAGVSRMKSAIFEQGILLEKQKKSIKLKKTESNSAFRLFPMMEDMENMEEHH